MKLFIFEKGVKAHFIPESLQDDILDELFVRFMEKPFVTHDKTEAFYDIGGMVMQDEEHLCWDLPGNIKLGTWVSHFEELFDELSTTPLREANNKPYYKLHGWMHCIVLTPEQRDSLLTQLKNRVSAYKEKALLANLEFEKRMADINKDGMKILHTPRINIPKDKD